jgi:hypothetical protein
MLSALLAIGSACGGEVRTAAVARDPAPTIELLITVDWEGSVLDEENTAAIERFRARYPSIRLTHFLNAAYYTKPDAEPATITRQIRRTIAPGDELGLHIHGWKSLVEASGVALQTSPSFEGMSTPSAMPCSGDCGYDVLLSAYSYESLRRLVRHSLDLLEGQGFGRAESFRASAWIAPPRVLRAIAAEGLVRDHSAVNRALLQRSFGPYLLAETQRLWPTVDAVTQPYRISTGDGEIWEVPTNGALVDYLEAPELVGVYAACVAEKRRHPERDIVLATGFHYDSAAARLPVLAAALDAMARATGPEAATLHATISREIPLPVEEPRIDEPTGDGARND